MIKSWFDAHRHLYPDDWPDLARSIKEAANWRCENCGAEHGKPHPVNGKKTVITVAHIDAEVVLPDGTVAAISRHDKSHRHREALKSWCARCHLQYDHADHIRHAAETRRRNKIDAGQLEMEEIA